ncbi:MAG: carbohydrate ABC transporter permease [Spirochaetia bacterium]|nr:carbohydrate ABC transporter permease [Spirochaetia bacterium]MDD7612426.1 carbohydrate ABC transporter permease [Spirochaetales bacterium]MDY4524990.1 carbohydrate ABC transporter permease [Treponema sp.]MDY5914298.1 carbohydrate ABC transporter permease [Treponema sp.]
MVEKRSINDIIFDILNYAFFIIFTLICVFPFYYLFINTISDNGLVSKGLVNFYPRGLHIKNYIALKDVNGLGMSFIVTLARTVIGTIVSTVASGFVGYLVTKKEMWHRKIFYRFMIITMYFSAGLIPWFTTMQMLGLTNTFWAYIIPGIVSVYNIIMVKTYIESIPAELEESASIDGASYMTIFVKIIWPLSKPILATIAIWCAVGHWNSFQDSLVLMSGAPKLKTLQERLYIYLNQSSNLAASMGTATTGLSETQRQQMLNTKSIQYTVAMVTAIPILCVYPFMQKYFVKGLMLGAVKG